MKILLICLSILFFIWITYGYTSSQVKEPKFTVISKTNTYEIRQYEPYIEARVTVSGTYRDVMSSGFRTLARYIFGDNTKKQSISMTAPVSETALKENTRIVTFVMPDNYTLETLPLPTDKRIEIVKIPAHKSAVLRYSGYSTAEKVAKMKLKLLKQLKKDSILTVGIPRSARYNPPWTPPFMNRNEIIIDIQEVAMTQVSADTHPQKNEIILAGGCFWGMQDLFRKQPGILSTEVGYTGGTEANPTYKNHDGHAEAIRVVYDPHKTSYKRLLDFFFQIHNPTTLNQQGNDKGTSYRSAIFYGNDQEKKEAQLFIDLVNKSRRWPKPVVTSLEPLGKFTRAEEYHQDYLEKNPGGYTCHAIYFDSYLDD